MKILIIVNSLKHCEHDENIRNTIFYVLRKFIHAAEKESFIRTVFIF